MSVRRALSLGLALGTAWLAASAASSPAADAFADAPQERVTPPTPLRQAASYAQALAEWRGADDVNAFIAARFAYDRERALRLSESQRAKAGPAPIHAPEAFFAAPSGVCVDLARFAVETLRAIDPGAKPAYVMIEFEPLTLQGQTLRRHWVASFERDGKRWFFADSKRPGHVAGPYAGIADYIADYARYRQRPIVSFREVDTYERRLRTAATRTPAASTP